MRIEINPATGLIVVDTPDNSSGAEFVRELLSGQKPAAPKAIESNRVGKKPGPKPGSRRRKLAPPRADRPLSRQLDEAWAWMAASDRPEGVTAEELAKAFDLSQAGGLYRINELIKRDMAWRVGPGRFRVGSVADAEVMLNGSSA